MPDKWGRRLFKAGAVMAIVFGLVHAISFFKDLVPSNDTERQLLGLMSDYRFDLAGSMRSMSDLMQGFSTAFTLAALGFGAFDLVISRERSGLLKRAALVNVLWLAALTAVSLRYFFIVPTAFLCVTLALFAAAWAKLPAEAS